MSRAHMLYDDKKISSVINVKWKGKWQEETIFRLAKNQGFMIEGTVEEKTRLAICDESGNTPVYRYYAVLQVEFKKGFRRTFSSTGQEIEPWKTATKKINTGHLMSSYKTVAAGTSAVNWQDIATVVEVPQLRMFLPDHLKSSNSVLLFYNETSLTDVEVNSGDLIRIKTKGNGPYIECLAKLDQGHHVSSSKYESGACDQISWTDKIMSMKTSKDETADQPDGVDESEWDD